MAEIKLHNTIGKNTLGANCPKPISIGHASIRACHLYGDTNISFSDIYPDHIQFTSGRLNNSLHGYLPSPWDLGAFHKGSKSIKDVGEIRYFYYAAHNGFICFGGSGMRHSTRYRAEYGDDLQYSSFVTTYPSGSSLLAELRDPNAISLLEQCTVNATPFKLRVRLA